MLIFATMINDVDDRAFMQEVYQQNERLMYAIALKYASNTQDCEDIVHDTVERLCKNIIKIKGLPNSALRAYVVYAVRNTAINFRKHQATINRHIQQLSDDVLSSEYDQPESIIERIEDLKEKRTSLTKVWMQLTDAEQELLYRKYVLEQTTEELAGIFQCSRDSIRMRLSRVRRKSLRLMKGDMAQMTRHERLLENYEDAYFALLMEDVAQVEGARLDQLNMELQNDPHTAVPEELTKRCLRTINAHFSNMRRNSSLRIVKKAINLAAILIAISTLLFTSAFAISDEFRTATLNLVIAANEKYTQLKMKQEDTPQESGNTVVADDSEFFKNIRLAWLPEGYEYLSGEYDYQAIFANDANEWITINRFDGASTYNVDTEGAEIVEEIMINGNSGLRIVKNGQTHIALANTDKNIFIDIFVRTRTR